MSHFTFDFQAARSFGQPHKSVIFVYLVEQNSTGNLGNLWKTSWQPLGFICGFFLLQHIGLKDFSVLFSPFSLLLLDILAIDTGFKKGRGNRQGGGKSQFEFPARMILLKKSFVTFSSQKSRPVKRPSIPLAFTQSKNGFEALS